MTLSNPSEGSKWIVAAVVVLVTGIIFWRVTDLEWTNWDDDKYVYQNQYVLEGDYKAIFTSPVNKNYNPLPVAMHAWEWKMVKGTPDVKEKAHFFHLNNLWMHLVCTLLVYLLMLQLGLLPPWAGFAALLFGIHPMHVESVAWITERKDLMFGMFYIGALLAYLRYLDSRKGLLYAVCLALFALALLSKIQAVSLPLSMLAIDWYRHRKLDRKLFLEKVPFFIGSLTIGLLGIHFLAEGDALGSPQKLGLVDQMAMGLSAFCTYLVKAIIPYETSAFYPYPKAVGFIHYLGLGAAVGLTVGAYLLRRISRETAFGFAFFVLNIVFVLQILGSGNAYKADRFSYVAFVGLFFAAMMVLQRLVSMEPWRIWVVSIAMGAFCLICMALSWAYIPVWHDSGSLWTYVIGHYPDGASLEYMNRGMHYRDAGHRDLAMKDFDTSIQKWPQEQAPYLYRGNLRGEMGLTTAAIGDYSMLIQRFPASENKPYGPLVLQMGYRNRGLTYEKQGAVEAAIRDFDSALMMNPEDIALYKSRGNLYVQRGDYERAAKDFGEVVARDPQDGDAYHGRGFCYLNLGRYRLALADLDQAIALIPGEPNLYYNRAHAHAFLGQRAQALLDAHQCKALGKPAEPEFLQSLQQ